MPVLTHADYCRADMTADTKILDRTCHACRNLALGKSLRREPYDTLAWSGERRTT